MLWHGVLIAVVASALGGTNATGIKAQQRAPRDSAQPELRIVRGQVKSDDDSATLLRRAQVTVISATTGSVFTDQDGRFEISVPAKSYTIRVTKPGFAPQYVQGVDGSPSGPLDIRLARGAAINGHVIDSMGTPVVDARVTVRAGGEAAVRGRVPVNVVTRTDDLGEFRVGSLPAGRYAISVDASARVVVTGAAVAPAPGSLAAGPAPPASRSTRADDSAAEARPTAAVVRAGEETSVTVLLDRRSADSTDAMAYAAGYEAAAQGAVSVVIGGVRTVVRPSTSRGAAILTGRVTDPYARGVAGAIVRLNPTSAGLARVAATDQNGRYQFTGVAPGSYRVVGTKRSFLDAEHGQERAGQPGRIVTLRDRQRLDRVDIGLMRGASISGIVTDPDGEPMEGLAMHAWRLEYRGGRPVNEGVGVVVRTDDRGRYRLHGRGRRRLHSPPRCVSASASMRPESIWPSLRPPPSGSRGWHGIRRATR
jgi:protocatechuate 3,4-dioxygenase beta subunit